MRPVYVGEHPSSLHDLSIFLAGPSPRGQADYNWRPEALKYLETIGFPGNVFVPIREDGGWLGDDKLQMDWELDYLDAATVVVFWIPRSEQLPGHTTDKEWGMFVRSGKAVVGYPLKTKSGEKTPGMGYIDHVSKRYRVPVFHNLDDTLRCATSMCYR